MSVNLVEAWEPYKAAKLALANSLEASNVKAISQRYGQDLSRLNTELQKYSMEGTLTEQYVLDNTAKLLNAIRRCNVCLRWMILHTADLPPSNFDSSGQ